METNLLLCQIMQRYKPDIHSKVYSAGELQYLGFDSHFIFTLLKAFEDEKEFPEKELNSFSLDTILDYILRTHRYYLNRKLPEIEQTIYLLCKNYETEHPLLLVLRNFYKEYAAHLRHHIMEEEQELLPYVSYLKNAVKENMNAAVFFMRTKNYSLKKFNEGHDDTEEDLSQIRQVILSYDPPRTNETPYRILLSQLQVFEKDLGVHALMEDRILIPHAVRLESKIYKRFSKLVKLN